MLERKLTSLELFHEGHFQSLKLPNLVLAFCEHLLSAAYVTPILEVRSAQHAQNTIGPRRMREPERFNAFAKVS